MPLNKENASNRIYQNPSLKNVDLCNTKMAVVHSKRNVILRNKIAVRCKKMFFFIKKSVVLCFKKICSSL